MQNSIWQNKISFHGKKSKQTAYRRNIAVVQSLSHVRLFATPWNAAHQVFSVNHYIPEFFQIHVPWVSYAN